ncbi:hypothetical protein F4775DRAFT_599069 [Biscogniauxia sp. FL1348]|nr:hypothetical protein F4775DRAFT_599069 [Biscogniauxia sp. FL1348]
MSSQGAYNRPGRKYAQPHNNGGANNGSFHNVIFNNAPNMGFTQGPNPGFGHANHMQSNNNTNSNNNSNAAPMNPNYKGRPENYNPNFKKGPPHNDFTHQNFQAQQNHQQHQWQPRQPGQNNKNSNNKNPGPPPLAPKGPSNPNPNSKPQPNNPFSSPPNLNPFSSPPNPNPFSSPPNPNTNANPHLVDIRDPAIQHAALASLLRRSPDAEGDEWMCGCAGAGSVVTCRDGAAAAQVALARRHEQLRDDVRQLFARMGAALGQGQFTAWIEGLAGERPGSEVLGLIGGSGGSGGSGMSGMNG